MNANTLHEHLTVMQSAYAAQAGLTVDQLSRELAMKTSAEFWLQRRVSDLTRRLAKFGRPPQPAPDLCPFAYEHSELGWIDTFLYVPKGCDDIEDIEVQYVYLRGVDITERMADSEIDDIAVAYSKKEMEA